MTALEKEKISVGTMNKIEIAVQQINTVNSFLTLCCLMQQTAKAVLNTLQSIEREGAAV